MQRLNHMVFKSQLHFIFKVKSFPADLLIIGFLIFIQLLLHVHKISAYSCVKIRIVFRNDLNAMHMIIAVMQPMNSHAV